jgi:hypothetical protein
MLLGRNGVRLPGETVIEVLSIQVYSSIAKSSAAINPHQKGF